MPSPAPLPPLPDGLLLHNIALDPDDLDAVSCAETIQFHRLDSAQQLHYGSCISSPAMERVRRSPHLRHSYTTSSTRGLGGGSGDKRRPGKPPKGKPLTPHGSSRSARRLTTVVNDRLHFHSFGSQEYYHGKQCHKQQVAVAAAAALEPQSKLTRRKSMAPTVFGWELNCGGWSICSGRKSVDTVNINSTSGQRLCKICAGQRPRKHADQPGGSSEGKQRQRQLSRHYNVPELMDSSITISMSPSTQGRSYNARPRSFKQADSSSEPIVFDHYSLPSHNHYHVRMGAAPSSSSYRKTRRNRRRVARNSSPYSLKSDKANLGFASGTPLSDLLHRSSSDSDMEAMRNHNQVSISPARPSWPSITSNDDLSNEHNGTTHPFPPSSSPRWNSPPAIENPASSQTVDLSFRFMDACSVSSSPENQPPSTIVSLPPADAHDRWVEMAAKDYRSTNYDTSPPGRQHLCSFRFPDLAIDEGQNADAPIQWPTRVLANSKPARHDLNDITSSDGISVEVQAYFKNSDLVEASSLSSSSVKVKVNDRKSLLNTPTGGAHPSNKPYSVAATSSNSYRSGISYPIKKPPLATFEVTPPYINTTSGTSRRPSTSTTRRKGPAKGDSSSRRMPHYDHEHHYQLRSPAKHEVLMAERRTSRLTPSRRGRKFRRNMEAFSCTARGSPH